jgi:ketosteroid isomerase-like protein
VTLQVRESQSLWNGVPLVTPSNDLKDAFGNVAVMRHIDPPRSSRLLSVTPMGMLRACRQVDRNRFFAMGFAVLMVVTSSGLLTAMPRAEKHETRHQIEHLEDTWRNALLHGNIPAMDALLADDYMAISPTGILQSKEQAMASLRAGNTHFTTLELSDRKIRLYGTTALVTSRAEVSGSGPDGDLSGSYRYTRVYVKDVRGIWHIVSFEASKIKEPESSKLKEPTDAR